MKTAQLLLIEKLSLIRIKDSPSSPTSRKVTAPSILPLALVLLALLSGPVPLEQLQQIAGANDSATLVAELCQLGVAPLCHDVPVFDADGDFSSCTVCTMSVIDARRICGWIKTSGGGHA